MDIVSAILWLALNIYHEGRGEPEIGQHAIAHVTLNRAKKKDWPIKRIVLQPKQFSWTHQLDDYTAKDLKAFQQCEMSALKAMKEKDFTGGALYYHRYDIKPNWNYDKLRPIGRWGNHIFYGDYDVVVLYATSKVDASNTLLAAN